MTDTNDDLIVQMSSKGNWGIFQKVTVTTSGYFICRCGCRDCTGHIMKREIVKTETRPLIMFGQTEDDHQRALTFKETYIS